MLLCHRAAAAHKRHERLDRACDGRLVVGVAIIKVAQRASRRSLRPRAAAAQQRHERLDGTCTRNNARGRLSSSAANSWERCCSCDPALSLRSRATRDATSREHVLAVLVLAVLVLCVLFSLAVLVRTVVVAASRTRSIAGTA